MKNKRMALLLAFGLSILAVTPAMALEDAILPEAVEAEEDILLPEATETEESTLPSEAAGTEENELVIELLEVSEEPQSGLPEESADPQNAVPAEDTAVQDLVLDAQNFPDEAFRSCLSQEKYDKDQNGALSSGEIAAVTEIDVIGKGVSDLTGLAYFPALETLQCDNNSLTALDVSKNPKLKTLTCTGNLLTGLDVDKNASLFSLVCSDNQIDALDLSQNTKLQDLRCAGNKLTELDISKNTALAMMDCSQNSLTALDASGHAKLTYLFCSDNHLTTLNVSGTTKLQWLKCSQNQLTALDVSDCLNVSSSSDSAVNILDCADNCLTSLNISGKSYFKGLICSGNALTELSLASVPDLRQLECADNTLKSLDVTKNKKLQRLDCSGNQLTSLDLRSLSLTETTVLPDCSGQKLSIASEETDSGQQIDIEKIIGIENCSVVRMTAEEAAKSTGTEKSTWGSIILLAQEDRSPDGILEDGILTFTNGQLPETLNLLCATGYQKKAGEKDVLLEVSLHCHTHVYVEVERREPACTEDGFLKQICTICGDAFEKILPKTGHQNQLIELLPTCTKDGSMYQLCSVCGYREPETVLPAKGHNYSLIENIAATCTEDGRIQKRCLHCQDEIVTTLPAAGHTWGAFVVTRDATIFEAGEKSRTCSVCGSAETEAIPKLEGTINPAADKLPVQVKDQVSVQSLVTGLQEDDYVVSWSSDNPEIAAVSEDGTITAKKTGIVNITVTTRSGAATMVAVRVQTDPVATESITGLAKNVSLAAGKKLRLRPVLTPVSSREEITYKSSDKKIARVSAKGIIKGIKKGTAKITVRSGSKKFTVTVKVTAPAVKKIKNVPAKKTLRKGKTFRLKPRLVPAGVSQNITYKSSDKKIVSVTAKGRIRAKKKGTATITVSAGGAKAACRVVVTE